MIAGLDTVAASLACFLSYLARHPDERRRLVADPSLWPSAIEELLRFESPVTDGGRIALADLELPSGEHIAAGSAVWASRGTRPTSIPTFVRRSAAPSTSAAPRTPTSHSRAGSTGASVRTWPAWRCTSRSRSGTSGSPTTRSRRDPTSPTAATRARRTISRSPGEHRRHADPGDLSRGDPGLVGRAPHRRVRPPPGRRRSHRRLAGGSCASRGSASWPPVAGSASRGRSSTAAAAGTLEEELVFLEEHFRARAPYWVGVHGRDLFGPTLLHAGTAAQKARFLPRIMACDEMWGQGFSEPEAGSDLGGVRTRAVRDGDEWVLNGQKIWMTFGTHADWLYVLCRTNADAPKHRGLSLILVPAHQPRRRHPADPEPRRRRGVRRGVLLRCPHPGRPRGGSGRRRVVGRHGHRRHRTWHHRAPLPGRVRAAAARPRERAARARADRRPRGAPTPRAGMDRAPAQPPQQRADAHASRARRHPRPGGVAVEAVLVALAPRPRRAR